MFEPHVDPRVKRTRAALRAALATILRERGFEDVTLQEVADAAGLNRATIYKHYADKFALLDAWIADDLRQRLTVAADPACASTGEDKLARVVAATCECWRWIGDLGRPDDRLLRPIAAARIGALVLRTIEFALDQKIVRAAAKPELAATMASFAICGAAMAWAAAGATSPRALAAHVAKTIAALGAIIVGNPAVPRVTGGLRLE